MATITFTTKIAGVLTNVTSVVLADPASPPTYGLRRVDTGQVIVAANTVLANPSAGTYTVTFTAVAGVTYQGYIAWTYAGETHHQEVLHTEPMPSVTTPLSLANAIAVRFRDEVATPRALATIYDNDPADPPKDGSLWCRFSVRDGESQRITAGVRQYRTVGVAIAQLFASLGEGTKDLREAAGAIVTAFRNVTADGIRYGVPYLNNIGNDQNGKYQLNVTCPFQEDTVEP